MACAAPLECTAVGWYDSSSGPRLLRAALKAGHLRVTHLGTPSSYTSATWDGFGISCWQAAECAAFAHGSAGTLMYRQDGTTWTHAAGSVRDADLADISCSSSPTCAAVGRSAAGWPAAATLTGDGTWSTQTFDPTSLSARADQGTLDTVSCATQECVAFGHLGSTVHPAVHRAIYAVGTDLPVGG
jgi:hypothetical protein